MNYETVPRYLNQGNQVGRRNERCMPVSGQSASKTRPTHFPIGGLHVTSSKHDYRNYDRFLPNFDLAYKTIQRVSASNLKSFGPTKTELRAKEVREFPVMLYLTGK